MRSLLLHIALVISLLFSVQGSALPTHEHDASEVSQPLSEQLTHEKLPNKDLTLSSAQYIIHFSDENGISLQVQSHHSGGHSQSAQKHPFRLIKSGKNIDVRQHPFIRTSIVHLASINTADRYLYVVRRIRI